jgi:hypothetical protein
MRRWHPSLDLARLLEALSEEILAAADEEVRQTSDLQGWKIAGAAQEVRGLIAAGRADVDVKLDGSFDQDLNEDSSEPRAGGRLTRGGRCSSHHQGH